MLEKDNQIYGLDVLSILDANGANLKLYDAEIKSSRNCIRTIYNGPCDKKNNLIESSCKIFKYMNGHDFGRADFRISTQGIPYFLEMAPLPSLAQNGSFCQCAQLCDYTLEYIFRSIIESSLNRYCAADLLKKS